MTYGHQSNQSEMPRLKFYTKVILSDVIPLKISWLFQRDLGRHHNVVHQLHVGAILLESPLLRLKPEIVLYS